MNIFREFWRAQNGAEIFQKSDALTKAEIVAVQKKIEELQTKGLPSSKIISALQKFNGKLSQKWQAERAYWTGVKKEDTQLVAEAGDDLGISKYKVILSPNACKICISKTQNGSKLFKSSEVEKSGYGHVPPFHPNCFCILIPFE